MDIKKERVDRAEAILGELVPKLTDPEIMILMITCELNFYDHVKYDADGLLTWDMTDLQLVAFAAGVVAVAESGGYLSSVPQERNQIRIGRVWYPEKVDA